MPCFLRSAVTCLLALLGCASPALHAQPLRIAAASDLKFALDAIATEFTRSSDPVPMEIVYGSSGKFFTQIQQGAPYDLYFSSDIRYPEQLAASGQAASPVIPYAVGRLVLWSAQFDARTLALADLEQPRFRRIAIANPRHAPYGQRAEQALRAAGLWSRIEPRLVYGENIAQTAQFVQTGNAEVGLVALSLALSPALSSRGGYTLIPANLHEPLRQGFIITRHGRDQAAAARFAQFMTTPAAQKILLQYGFERP